MTRPLAFVVATTLALSSIAWGGEQDYAVFRAGMELEKRLMILDARDKFREALAMDPGNAGYLEHYAWFLQFNGFNEEAAGVFRRAIPMKVDRDALYRGLAWNEKVVGRLADALAAYEKAVRIETPREDLKGAMEEVGRRLSQESDAEISLLKGELSKNPGNYDLLRKLRQAYVSRGDFDGAIGTAEKILARHPGDMPSRMEHARVLFWGGRKEQAEAAYKSLLVDSPDNAFLYFELGGLQSAMGKLPEARQSLEKSLALYPDAARSKKELAEVLARMGKHEEAIAMASSIGPTEGERLTARLALARSRHFSGRLREAAPIYREILKEYPYNADALWGLTETSLYTGDFDTAGAVLEKWRSAGEDGRFPKQKALHDSLASPALGAKAEYYSNSSNLIRINDGFDQRLHGRMRSTFDLGYYHTYFHQSRFDSISRLTLFAEGEAGLAERLRVGGRIAGNFYTNDQNHLNGRFSLSADPARNWVVALNYERLDIIDTELPFRNALYNYVVTIGSVGRKIQTNDYSVYVQGSPIERLELAGKFLYGDYTDGNRKSSVMLDASWRVFDNPGVRIGYNYFYLDYKDPAPLFVEGGASTSAYYDPKNLEVHTLYLGFRHELAGRLFYGLEERISHIPKSDGIANSVFAFVAFPFGPRHGLRLDGRYFYQNDGVDRSGNSGHFSADNVIVSYEFKF